MKKKALWSRLIYVIAVVGTLALLLSVNSTTPYMALLPYLFLPIGLFLPELLIPLFFIASLSSDYFIAGEGVGFTRILALVIIAGAMSRLILKRKKLQRRWLANFILIMVVSLISFLLSYDKNIIFLLVMGLNILVFIAIANLPLSSDQVVQLFRAILVAVLVTTLYYSVTFILNPDFLENGRLTIAEGLNENRYGMMMAQMSAFCLVYIYFTKKNFVKSICLLAGMINVYFVLLSGSRSALLGIALGFIFTVLIASYVQKKIKKRFFGMALICAIAMFVFYIVIELNPMLAYRMNIDQLVATGGTRRWPRIVAEIQYLIPTHFFFGVGQGAMNEKIALSQYMTDPGSSHNFIVSALSQLGIVGFIAYMSFYWRIIKDTVSKVGEMQILIIPLMLILTAFFNGVGEVIYTERLFWNALALAGLCLVTNNKSNTMKNHGLLKGKQ